MYRKYRNSENRKYIENVGKLSADSNWLLNPADSTYQNSDAPLRLLLLKSFISHTKPKEYKKKVYHFPKILKKIRHFTCCKSSTSFLKYAGF